MRKFVQSSGFVALAWAFACAPAQAAFHLWDINEIFSNADGSVQFIELISPVGSSGENQVGGHTIRSNSRTFTFPNNLPSPMTSGRTFLVATPAFATTLCAPTPDYTVPAANFFSTTSDTLNFSDGFDTVSFAAGQLPLDGRMSINRIRVAGISSPKNFSNQAGTLWPGIPGDIDADRDVDLRDVTAFVTNYGLAQAATPPQGDLSCDSRIGLADIVSLQNRLPAASGSPTAVPEPSTVALGIIAAASCWLVRRFRG